MRSTVTRKYRNPSVHEVVADVLFDTELGDKEFGELPARLEAAHGKPLPLELQTLGVVSAPGSPAQLQFAKALAGWQFVEGEAPKWFLRVQKNRFTLNMARSDSWPKGHYVGWEAVLARLRTFIDSLGAYSGLAARRLGLRYINRFSIPASSPLSDWCYVQPVLPAPLSGKLGTSVRTTVAELPGHERFSATISLVQEDGRRGNDREGELPFLLDIDVFNLQPGDAPRFDRFIEWFEDAHSAENAVFELCITDKLRQRFEGE